MFTFLEPKIENYFYCEKCDYKCTKKSLLDRHENTRKHLNVDEKSSKSIICVNCDKSFSCRQSLYVHKKKCIKNEEKEEDEQQTEDIVEETKEQNLLDLLSIENFMELMKQNNEFKDLILEQNKIIADLAKNASGNINNSINNSTINSHNKTFNLQVFLNERCKDAMNIDEFVDSLKLTFNDLENVGELGFVKGISRIFINGLRELDVYKRPIHCSDLKREVIHLKEDGVWLKDNENKDSMKKLVKMIANKNISKIYEWKAAYPSHRYSDDPKNDIYLKFLCQSMGAKTREEDIVYYEKVIKNVAKEVTIDKNRD